MEKSKRKVQTAKKARPKTANNRRDAKINMQSREKLSQILIDRFINKFNVPLNNKIIVKKEVEKLLQKESINEKDLKQLENTIKNKLSSLNSQNILKSNLKKKQNINNFENEENAFIPDNAKNEDLNNSCMSGASDLEKFNEKTNKDIEREKAFEKYKNCQSIRPKSSLPKIEIDYSKYKNEWDAINQYNKQKYEEDLKEEKMKNWEVKMRTRADLTAQIKEKIKKEYEKELKNKEYDKLVEKHIKNLDAIELEKQKVIKQKAMKEKELRDKQKRESYVNKRIETLKDKLYEKELIRHNKEENRKAIEKEQLRKKQEHDNLIQTIKDNELHKKILKEEKEKEKEEDIKMMQDSIADEMRQDIIRKKYFERIERQGNTFNQNALETVLKKKNEKMLENEKKMQKYLDDKEKMMQNEEYMMMTQKKNNQKMLRDFYAKQMLEKKQREDYEKQIDKIQADIWKNEYQKYLEHEKETNKLIKDYELQNVKMLDNQVKMGKYDVDRMTNVEKAMNRELLEKVVGANK